MSLMRRYLFPTLMLVTLGMILVLWKLDYTPSEWIEYTYNGTAVTYPFSNWVADHIREFTGMEFKVNIPLAFQALILVLMIDFIRYWMHRWMHEKSVLWRFHALHHLPERVGVATSTRTHPVDDFLLYVPEMIILFTLGFNRTLVAFLYCFIWVISLIKHSNIEIEETWFSKHFQIPQFHLNHHKKHDGSVPTSNFSEILTFWDRVYGTFEGTRITAAHQVGVPSEKPRSLVREFLGWANLPSQKM